MIVSGYAVAARGCEDVSLVQKRRWGSNQPRKVCDRCRGAESSVHSWRWQPSAGSTSWSAGSPHVPRSPLVRGPAPHRKPMRAVMVGVSSPIAPATLVRSVARLLQHHHCRSYPAIDCSSIVSEALSSSESSPRCILHLNFQLTFATEPQSSHNHERCQVLQANCLALPAEHAPPRGPAILVQPRL